MARATLSIPAVIHGSLPDVCVVCGQGETMQRVVNLRWTPWWLWLLLPVACVPWLILSLLLSRNVTARLPVCRRHWDHWVWRSLLFYFCLGLSLALPFVAGYLSDTIPNNAVVGVISYVLLACGILLFPLTILVGGLLRPGEVRAVEITDHAVTLTAVHPKFCDALYPPHGPGTTPTDGWEVVADEP